jgi:hypothetical protein
VRPGDPADLLVLGRKHHIQAVVAALGRWAGRRVHPADRGRRGRTAERLPRTNGHAHSNTSSIHLGAAVVLASTALLPTLPSSCERLGRAGRLRDAAGQSPNVTKPSPKVFNVEARDVWDPKPAKSRNPADPREAIQVTGAPQVGAGLRSEDIHAALHGLLNGIRQDAVSSAMWVVTHRRRDLDRRGLQAGSYSRAPEEHRKSQGWLLHLLTSGGGRSSGDRGYHVSGPASFAASRRTSIDRGGLPKPWSSIMVINKSSFSA